MNPRPPTSWWPPPFPSTPPTSTSESQSTIIDTFPRLLSIAQNEGEYEDFVPGRVCGWGRRYDDQCVGRARSVHARHVEGVEGVQSLAVEEDVGKRSWTNSSTEYVYLDRSDRLPSSQANVCLNIYIHCFYASASSNSPGFRECNCKAHRKGKDKLAWNLR